MDKILILSTSDARIGIHCYVVINLVQFQCRLWWHVKNKFNVKFHAFWQDWKYADEMFQNKEEEKQKRKAEKKNSWNAEVRSGSKNTDQNTGNRLFFRLGYRWMELAACFKFFEYKKFKRGQTSNLWIVCLNCFLFSHDLGTRSQAGSETKELILFCIIDTNVPCFTKFILIKKYEEGDFLNFKSKQQQEFRKIMEANSSRRKVFFRVKIKQEIQAARIVPPH